MPLVHPHQINIYQFFDISLIVHAQNVCQSCAALLRRCKKYVASSLLTANFCALICFQGVACRNINLTSRPAFGLLDVYRTVTRSNATFIFIRALEPGGYGSSGIR